MYKNTLFALLLLFWANTTALFAQNSSLPDSIVQALTGHYNEENRIEYLLSIVTREQYVNPDLAKLLANEAYVCANANGNTFLEAQASYWAAWLEYQHDKIGFLGGAISKANISQSLFEQSQDPLGLARIYCLKGALAFDSNDTIGAKNFIEKAYAWIPKIKNQRKDSLWVMGYLRQLESNLLPSKDRIKVQSQSLNLYEQAGDSIRIGRICLKLLGPLSAAQDFKTAIQYAIRARNAFAAAKYDEGVRSAYLDYLSILLYQYALQPAEPLFQEAVRAIKINPSLFETDYRFPMRLASLYSHKSLATTQQLVKQTYADSAQIFIDMAWKSAKNTQNVDDLRVVYENMVYTCGLAGNCDTVMIRTANSFLEQLQQSSAKTARIQDELANRYTLDRQRTLREERQRQNQIMWGGLGVLAFFLLGSGLYIQRRNIENMNRALRSRMEALRAQMNPHFIANALNAIESLVNQNRNKEASHYIIQFSRLCRGILNNSRNEASTLEEELTMLDYFMSLEQLRMGERLQYFTEIDPKLNTEEIALPSMLLQPFVENSIWHGIMPKSSGGTVSLKATRLDDKFYQCIVEDDGIGRKKSEEIKERMVVTRPSLGLAITQERIEKLYKFKGSRIIIDDLYHTDGTASGTRVTITLPIQSITDKQNESNNR